MKPKTKSCVELINGQVVHCIEYNKCWYKFLGGYRLKQNNPCGYTPPTPTTGDKSGERELRDVAIIRHAEEPRTDKVEKD